MDVRLIDNNDLDGFYALFREVSAEGRFSARSSPPPREAVERALLQVREHHWPVYVVEHQGVVVASAEAYPESFCKPGGDEQVGVLGMQVKRDFRRQGLGAALLDAVLGHCRARGWRAVDLVVLASNCAARALYEKAGFKHVEELPACTTPSGEIDLPMKMRILL